MLKINHSARRLNRLARINHAASYLEIGVSKGGTFLNVDVERKTAVDPKFKFDTMTTASPLIRYFEMLSDDFFLTVQNSEKFDLIFIDGLHTFEQTLRDFINTLFHAREKTIWLIDDTVPSDFASSLPDPALTKRHRQEAGLSSNAWHGDVFKVALAIHDFFPSLSYRTIVSGGNPQTVVWRQPRKNFKPFFKSMETISCLDYFELIRNFDLMRPGNEQEIIDYLDSISIAKESVGSEMVSEGDPESIRKMTNKGHIAMIEITHSDEFKNVARIEDVHSGEDSKPFGKILIFQNARVAPYRRVLRDGRHCLMGGFQFPESTPERFRDAYWLPDPESFANDEPPVEPGHFLYGGLFYQHFGHFMAECIHRLWAWPHKKHDYDGVVFATIRSRFDQDLPGFIQQTLALFGIPLERSLFVHAPRRFGVLHVPELGRRLDRSSANGYEDILAQVLAQPEPRKCGARLYLSRRLLPWSKGHIFGERLLEQWLAAQGYEILHPECLTLEEQIARYRGAAEIIVSGGSAINGLQLIPNLSARVVIIQRRHREAYIPFWRDCASAGSFVNAIDWIGGLATYHCYSSALNPEILMRGLSEFWGCKPTCDLDPDQFRDQAFDDFVAWFQADAARALESEVYTESKAQKILQGYFAHLKRQGGPTPKQQSELRRLASIYGDGSALD